jgi:hypothetical protein
MSGPFDGAELYPPDRSPCLVCGLEVPHDFDGPLAMHWNDGDEGPCPGSRTSWEVPS